jgi:acetyl-CoA C-acetyltransferase
MELFANIALTTPGPFQRHYLRYDDMAMWEIYEAFAAQVVANVAAHRLNGWAT